MRKSEAAGAVATAVAKHFPEDVAEAIKLDQEMYDAVIYRASTDCGDADEIDQVLAEIGSDLEDRTKDWLVDGADSPAGWLYAKMRG
jgi:molybdopterin biosynthesis enzyme